MIVVSTGHNPALFSVTTLRGKDGLFKKRKVAVTLKKAPVWVLLQQMINGPILCAKTTNQNGVVHAAALRIDICLEDQMRVFDQRVPG